jgi:hypothetical protein
MRVGGEAGRNPKTPLTLINYETRMGAESLWERQCRWIKRHTCCFYERASGGEPGVLTALIPVGAVLRRPS